MGLQVFSDGVNGGGSAQNVLFLLRLLHSAAKGVLVWHLAVTTHAKVHIWWVKLGQFNWLLLRHFATNVWKLIYPLKSHTKPLAQLWLSFSLHFIHHLTKLLLFGLIKIGLEHTSLVQILQSELQLFFLHSLNGTKLITFYFFLLDLFLQHFQKLLNSVNWYIAVVID